MARTQHCRNAGFGFARIRSQPFAAGVPDRLAAGCDFSTICGFPHVDLVNARAAAVVRNSAWRIALVCIAKTLWKCRGFYGAWTLLLFTGGDPKQFALAFATPGRRGVGLVRRSLYCDCRFAHPLRAAGSRVVGLAADCALWGVPGARGGLALLVGEHTSIVAWFAAL